MSRSVNKVILVGNLTRDPEIKVSSNNGKKIAIVGLATNREWVDSKGERNNMTEFHTLVAWGRLAEICEQFLRKGKLIYVEGYLKTRSWDDDNGGKRFRTEIVMNDMIMLDKRGGRDSDDSEYSDSMDSNSSDIEDMGDDTNIDLGGDESANDDAEPAEKNEESAGNMF